MLDQDSTTVSLCFCCGSCGAAVALAPINTDDLAYCCQNRCCLRAVAVDCPEALQLRQSLELPTNLVIHYPLQELVA
jgi:hypothetical protein